MITRAPVHFTNGVRLLERTPHGDHLTTAGRAFLPEDGPCWVRPAALTARPHAPQGRIIIGHVDGLIITPAVPELRRRRPDAVAETRHPTRAEPAPRSKAGGPTYRRRARRCSRPGTCGRRCSAGREPPRPAASRITPVPPEGAPDTDVVLAGRIGDPDPLIDEFRTIAAEHLTGPV
ncbi:hypothetical protein [Actinoplanes sp. G11-F43]|uniref:hypothetical protein n=1 Tax=Actinoplanes sp. G11-F43 TaxID=3424130 RepID=UPI003D356484